MVGLLETPLCNRIKVRGHDPEVAGTRIKVEHNLLASDGNWTEVESIILLVLGWNGGYRLSVGVILATQKRE